MNIGIFDKYFLNTFSSVLDRHKELTSSLAFDIVEGLRVSNAFLDINTRANLMRTATAMCEMFEGISIPKGTVEAMRVFNTDIGVNYLRNIAPVTDALRGLVESSLTRTLKSMRLSNDVLLEKFAIDTMRSVAPIFDSYKYIDFSPMVGVLQNVLISSEVLDNFVRHDFADTLRRLLGGFDVLYQNFDSTDDTDDIDIPHIETEYNLTVEENEKITSIVDIVITQPVGWQNIVVKKMESLKADNPVLYPIVKHVMKSIILIILAVIGGVLSHQFITRNDVRLRDEPSVNAETIITIPKNVIVIVVEDRSRWYRVEYNDFESEETYSGWLAKRNVEKYEYEEEDVE